MKAVITVIGTDKVGIIAKVSNLLLDHQINILDINQTIMQEFFTMIMMVDLDKNTSDFNALNKELAELGEQMELEIRIQREDIFQSMHRI